MASTDNAEAMRGARRVDSERKRRLVLAAADAQLEAGRHPTIAGIARQAGVGRKFIYDHPDLRAGIELRAAQSTSRQASDIVASARVTGASLRVELENARAQNHRLSRQLKALETRLSKAKAPRPAPDSLLPEALGTSSQISSSQRGSPNLTSSCSRPGNGCATPPRNSRPPEPSTASSCTKPNGP